MDLARLRVNLRPRTPWEGIDLGFVLARQWFLPLWLLWLVTAVPVFLLLNLLLPLESWVIGLLAWWCKPLYEPPLTFWLGRAVFAAAPHGRELQQAWWRILWPQLIPSLTWRRFSASRSFVMPVAVLEGLRGKARAARIQVLTRDQHAAGWLTLIGLHFELILELSLLVLLLVLLPEELQWVDARTFLFQPESWALWLQQLTGLLAMSVIAPFYVAAGFGLYLTRRSRLEAWDVELGLRRLAERVRTIRRSVTLPLGILSLLVGGAMLPTPVAAIELTPQEAKSLIESVMAEDDFGRRVSISYWKYIGEGAESEHTSELPWVLEWLLEMVKGFLQGFAAFGEGLLWLALGAVIAYLIVWSVKNRDLLGGDGKPPVTDQALPLSIAGLDIRPQSLPSDIVAEAGGCLARGDYRTALSLLYRGALSVMVHRDRFEIPASATEEECLQLVRQRLQAADYAYLEHLTRSWQRAAYGHRAPADAEAQRLCREWSAVYGE